MTEEIKHLAFKGIEKKEQIILKSFLNLAKNELEYQIVVLKANDTSDQQPDVLVIADDYEFEEGEKHLASLPCVVLGDDLDEECSGYVTRPIQWSNFRTALSQFSDPTPRHGEVTLSEPLPEQVSEEASEDVIDEAVLALVDDDAPIGDDGIVSDTLLKKQKEKQRVLPAEVKFAIDDVEDESSETGIVDDFEPINHEFELDNMSIDYASHTNSDYMKVVDDVQQFKLEEDELPSAMLLVTDDESNSTNSVLVIETNSLDAWDFSVSESSSAEIEGAVEAKESAAEKAEGLFDADEDAEIEAPKAKVKSGFDIAEGEKYWQEDNEVIADNVSVLYIKHQRGMVYSNREPGKWLTALQNKKLSKLPLSTDWRPKKGLTSYPLSQLVWVNSLMNETKELSSGLIENEKYILEKWPHFDLLQLDNVLLKLCSMLFVSPESLGSLVEKSGYSRSTVRGLMNACHKEGLLKKENEVKLENLIAAENDGVFGKIKDVFR